MNNTIQLKILTPNGVKLNEVVKSVYFTDANNGINGIYPNHCPAIILLKTCDIYMVNTENKKLYFIVGNGVVNVVDGTVTIMCDYFINNNDQSIKNSASIRAQYFKNTIEEKIASNNYVNQMEFMRAKLEDDLSIFAKIIGGKK